MGSLKLLEMRLKFSNKARIKCRHKCIQSTNLCQGVKHLQNNCQSVPMMLKILKKI